MSHDEQDDWEPRTVAVIPVAENGSLATIHVLLIVTPVLARLALPSSRNTAIAIVRPTHSDAHTSDPLLLFRVGPLVTSH